MNEGLKRTTSECLCGNWVMLIIDDRGPGRVYRWAPDDETLKGAPQLPAFSVGGFYTCPCGRIYRALDEEPWIDETPLKTGHHYRITTKGDLIDDPDLDLQFVRLTEGRAQFRGDENDYVFESRHIWRLEPGG